MHTLSRLFRRVAQLAVGATVALVADAAAATTLIDCDTPDDFCTGDPCVMTDSVEITVASCVLDFSPRALVLAKKVAVPNGGTLSLTAGSISVDRGINARHVTSTDGDGGDVSLVASGDIFVAQRIDVSGKLSNGTIELDAGADVTINQRLRARARGAGATATGGAVSVQADGTVTSAKQGRIEVRGKKNHTPAGTASVAGKNGVTLDGRIDARGTPGGGVTVTSSAGTVILNAEIRAGGESAAGGTVILNAAGMMNGIAGKVTASGDDANGGTLLMTAGGLAQLSSAVVRGLVGGTVAATASGISLGKVSVRGRNDAGTISLTSTVDNVYVYLLDGRAHDNGGDVDVAAAAAVTLENAELDATNGGHLNVNAGGDGVLGNSVGDDFDVSGTSGGEIEVQVGGNLTLAGDFSAQVGGCIGLSAGGVLDTSAASFDTPPTMSCP